MGWTGRPQAQIYRHRTAITVSAADATVEVRVKRSSVLPIGDNNTRHSCMALTFLRIFYRERARTPPMFPSAQQKDTSGTNNMHTSVKIDFHDPLNNQRRRRPINLPGPRRARQAGLVQEWGQRWGARGAVVGGFAYSGEDADEIIRGRE
mgnify:CR=1 FL=1